MVVLHTEARAAHKLAAFRGSREPWIVAVNMVSEGVDIPRLRVGVYATAAKTPMIFRQIVGRFVRTIPGQMPEPSWVYLPADPVLRGHAAQVQSELRRALRPREDNEGLDEPRERRTSEPSPVADFVPLSAEVAPQMTLFGPAAKAPTESASSLPALGAGSRGEPTEPATPAAFERRAALREERSRLVADLAKRSRSSHREINAWVNRAVGVSRVESASIEQLERSVRALVKELTRQSRQAASG